MSINPNDPLKPTVVHTTETVVRDRTPVIVEDNSSSKAWIAGLSVLAAALLIGFLWSANHPHTPAKTDVTVTNTERQATTPVTAVVATDHVVTQEPEETKVFITTTESSIQRLSRPNDAANQAEIEAIRARMEDLRAADREQAQAIREELQASIARLESQQASAPAAQTQTTTVTTSDPSATVTTESSSSAPASANNDKYEDLASRVEAASNQLSQLQSTAAPEASTQVAKLNEDLAAVRTKLSEASAATGQQQTDLIAQVDSELAALENAVTSVPIQ